MPIAHVIFTHPRKDSLNHQLYLNTLDVLKTLGYEIVESDLYQMLKDNHPAVMPFMAEGDSSEHPLIEKEQDKIKSSKLTILQFPLYWFTWPAVLQAYMEQVISIGLVPADKKFLESPLHDGRKIMFSITTGSTVDEYSAEGCNGSIENVFTPMNTAYRFIGYEIIKPFVFYSARSKTEAELKQDFEQHKQHLISCL